MSINTTVQANWNTIYIGKKETLNLASQYNSASTDAAKANIIKDIARPATAVVVTQGTVSLSVASNAYVYIDDKDNEVRMYFKNTTAASIALPISSGNTRHTFEGLSAVVGMEFWSSEIPFLKTMGDLGSESTVIEGTQFNKTFKIKSQGQIDGGSLDGEMYFVPGNAIQKWMRARHSAGEAVSICLRYQGAKDAADANSHFVAFDSFVSSNDRKAPFDDFATSSVVFPCNGQQYETDGALGTARWS